MTIKHLLHRMPAALSMAALLAIAPLMAQSQRIVVSGFQAPESVVHDPDLDLYLVSNVGTGNPAALDHNGFISRVSPDGSIQELRWIQDGVKGVTLNSPKGMWLHGRALYVTDVNTLRLFNRFTGAPTRNIEFPNPFAPSDLFLNDVVVADDGTVFVSDPRNNAIFIVDQQGRASVWAAGPTLGAPNGLLLDNGNVTWVTFLAGQVKRVTRSGKLITDAILPPVDLSGVPGLPPGAQLLDGYCRYNGSLLVTSWITGRVYRIRRSGMEVETVAQFVSRLDSPTPDGPADIGVDEERNRLLVPLFNLNQLVIIPLED